MASFTESDALLLACTEVLPGEWRDLSDLIASAGSVEKALSGAPGGFTNADLGAYLRVHVDPSRVSFWMSTLGRLEESDPDVWMVSIVDSQYPENLKAAYNRPPFVFVKGTLESEDQQALAIVGSRQASTKAQSAAAQLAGSFVERGMTIVSGLAEGVDAAAHRGALDAAGRTVAVMGTGVDLVFPPSHEPLAHEITGQGCLVSQFRPGSPPTKSTFPIRNGVISGLTLGSLLVEAQDRSGTLSEAGHARRQGRPVFLWGPLLNGDEWGIRWKKKRGVHVVDDVEQVVAILQSEATWSTPFTLG